MNPPKPYVLFPALRLGYAPFDDWHGELLDRLNALSALDESVPEARLSALRAFRDSFIEHLHFEIEVLGLLDYPHTDAHEAVHGTLEASINDLVAEQETVNGEGISVPDLAWFLLEDAIREDLKAKYFLEGKPEPPTA